MKLLSLGDSFRPRASGRHRPHQAINTRPRTRLAPYTRTAAQIFQGGKLSTPVATRRVEDRFIALSMEESELYREVEAYISDTYNSAAPKRATPWAS